MAQQKTPGQIAYEAAAVASRCQQPWGEANQKKWDAAADAIIALERARCLAIAQDDRIDQGNYGASQARWHIAKQISNPDLAGKTPVEIVAAGEV